GSLLAQHSQIEVDALALHEPIAEGRDVRERHHEGTARRRHSHPRSTARAAEGAPDDHDIISEGAAFVVWREVGKGREEALLVGRSYGRPALASQAQRVGLQEAVL